MNPKLLSAEKILAALLLLVFPMQALAARLEVGADAPLWAHLGAGLLLFLHVGGGAIGLVSGTTAVIARKGGKAHRTAGKVFLISMLISYVVAAGVAPFVTLGKRPNVVAAVLSVYLLLSGVAAARRRQFTVGKAEVAGLVVALIIIGVSVLFMNIGLQSPSGTIDGLPPQALILFISLATLGALGDLKVIIRRTLTNHARTIRHLWRMGAAFFIASSSFFLGQPQVFPDWFNASFVPATLALAPLIIALFWVVRLKVVRRRAMRV